MKLYGSVIIHKDFFGEDDWERKMIFLSEIGKNCWEFKYSLIVYESNPHYVSSSETLQKFFNARIKPSAT